MTERQPLTIVGQSVKTLKITVTSGNTGKFTPATKLKIGAFYVPRQIAINAEDHDIDREITVSVGGNPMIDHLPDLQAYDTAALANPETGILFDQDTEIDAEVYVPAGSTTTGDKVYLITIDYWLVLPPPRGL